jgi:hypothetical protein
MKNVLLLLRNGMLLLFLFAGLKAAGQEPVPCAINCSSSNDFFVTDLYLGFADKTPLPADHVCNGTETYTIWAVFGGSTSASRYSLKLFFNVYRDNVYESYQLTPCLYNKQSIPVGTAVSFGTVSYTCGDVLELRDFYMSWQTAQNKSCDCNNKCYYPGFPLVVRTPLYGDFTYTSQCVTGKPYETYTFTDNSGSGLPPYTYSWNFGTGASPATGSSATQVVEYSSGGSKSVTMIVTDSSSPAVSRTVTKEINVIGCCNLSITCVADQTRSVDAGMAYYTVVGTELDPTVGAANCGTVTITNTFNGLATLAGAKLPIGPTDIEWTATNGNQTQTVNCTVIVTVNDNEKPVITCPTVAASYDADGGVCYSSRSFTATATDNSGSVSVKYYIGSVEISFPYNFPLGSTIVTAIASDPYGNTASCPFTVVIKDNQAPAITQCPTAVIVNADPGVCQTAKSNVTLGEPVATDNCSGTLTKTNNAPNIFPLGDTNVTWTVTDASGNSTTCIQKVTVKDNQNPVPTCFVPTGTYPADAGQNYATVSFSSTATDNCGVKSIEHFIGSTKITSPYQFPLGSTIVKAVATDNSDNKGECTFTIVVGDGQAPVFTSCPVNITKDTDLNLCSASVVTPSPVYTDNVGVVTLTWVITGATAATSPASGINLVGTRTFDKGTSTVKYTAYDGSGNTATCQFTVTVNDKQAPKIDKCAADKTVFTDNTKCTTALANVDLGTVDASDNCGSIKSITNNAPTTFNIGVNNVTWTVMDGSGNTATCIQKITVVDNQKPVPVCFSPATSYGTDADKDYATVTFASTATDNCGMKSIEYFIGATKITSPYQFPLGSTQVKTVATDIYDNKEECTFTINVADGQAPSFTTCQGNVIKSTDAGKCHASVATVNPVATDNKGVVTLTWVVTGATAATSSASGINYVGTMNFDKGVSTVKYTAKDAAGNSALCTFTVTVEDKEAPVITCATPVNTIVIPPATGYLAGTELDPTTFSDNCPGATLTNNINGKASLEGHLFTQEGTTTITWTATDAANNTKQCTTSLTFFLGDCVVNGACGKTFVVELFPVRVRTTTVYRGYLNQAEVLSHIYSRCEPTEQLQVTFEKTVFTPKDWGDQNFIWVKVYSPFQNKTVTCDIQVIVRYPMKSGDMLANNPGEFGYENTNVDVSVYPNPTTGKFKIDIWNLNDPNVNAVIYNVNGAVVMQKQVTTTGEVDMDLRGNVPGLYLLRLVADKREFYHKIILENR